MSHAPVCRKSQQALAAAASIAASTKPAPHLVVLRVKRKRGDASVDSLLVSTDEATSHENDVPDRKRRAGTEPIEDTLAFLSISKAAEEKRRQQLDEKPSRLFYKRVRTTESDGSDRKKTTASSRVLAPPSDEHDKVVEIAGTGGGRLDTRPVSDAEAPPVSPPPDPLDYLEVRRIKARAIVTGTDSGRGSGDGIPSSGDLASSAAADFHVIDLQAVGRSGNGMDVAGTGDAALRGGATATRSAAPVLNPVERQMDEAIFKAFQTGDLSSVHGVIASSPATVNFRRRLGDGTTALMAAAFHGNVDTVRHLLSLGAKASLADAGGKSAALIAGMRGHRECFAELQRAADEERSAGSRKGAGREDFVYDLYYFEPPVPRPPASRGGETVIEGQADEVVAAPPGKTGEKTPDTTNAPVVRLSGIGPVDENAVWTTDVELKFEHDPDWSELGDGGEGEDPDSNSEGFYGNDYPEDEGDNDGTGGPYIYDGSSCPSEDGSSSDGRLDADNDVDPRRVLHAHDSAFDRLADVPSFSGGSEHRLAQTAVASDGARAIDNPFRTGLRGAEALAYSPQPFDGESSSDDL